ncbi:sugar transporter [Faucicola mancuniensis]|uniref:sugar transporter n=1 Tax=Faucicola mancuniensis TaxID=1309795 RepID=UPI003977C074
MSNPLQKHTTNFGKIRQTSQQKYNYINNLRQWRVIVLALSAFIFNTTEFIPIALLSDIGKSFAMPVEDVGIMMTIYAWIVAGLSLPAMLATANIERKKLLLCLFALFVGGHVLSVVATSFMMLLGGRAMIALAHAVFWSITASLAVRVAPKGRQTKALGLLAMGSALATVLGLPLGRMIGQWLGWRMMFGLIGVLALVAMVVLWRILPKLPSRNVGSIKSLPEIAKNIPLMVVYVLIMLMVTAHFTAYSYIEPFIIQINHFSEGFATAILLVFGVAGLLASFLFGRFYDKKPDTFLLGAMMGLLGALLMVTGVTGSQGLWVVLGLVWGVAITCISLALQLRVLKLAPNATDVAMSIFSGIYNIGIGGGALLGSVVIGRYGLGLVGDVGAGVAVLAIIIFAGFLLINRQKSH